MAIPRSRKSAVHRLAIAGEQRIDLKQLGGDFVVWKNTGTPAYQLAVVVDDAAMGITEVIRGDDLIPSTPRQFLLYRALGLTPPAFAHIPLVVGEDGRRLAKRHGDTRLAALRDAGVKPEALVGLLAWSCGWVEKPEPVTARRGADSFQPGEHFAKAVRIEPEDVERDRVFRLAATRRGAHSAPFGLRLTSCLSFRQSLVVDAQSWQRLIGFERVNKRREVVRGHCHGDGDRLVGLGRVR